VPGLLHYGMLREEHDLLGDLWLFRDDDRHDQVHDGDPAEAGEECQDGEQANDGWIDAEIVTQSRTNSRNHAVGRAACQLLVVGVHDVLLSMISTRTYAGGRRRLRIFAGLNSPEALYKVPLMIRAAD